MDIKRKKFFIVNSILVAGVLLSVMLIISKPSPDPESHQEPPPHLAEVVSVILESRPVTVASQGSVTPRIEIDITSQVSGEVVTVANQFAAGGFFKSGDMLLEIDPRDYQIALARAEATLAEAKNQLAQEKGKALQAKREWRDLGSEEANDLFLRKPQLQAAMASVKAAEAGVAKATLDLERTKISVPFDGRVSSISANLGQYVNTGATLGSVYASDVMEVKLPLTLSELKLLNFENITKLSQSPMSVDLSLAAGNDTLHWIGKVARLEASVDPKSRLFYLIAAVDKRLPEGNSDNLPKERSQMMPGSFVDALITSLPHNNVMTLPRTALYQSDQVFYLDDENRLKLMRVDVLQSDAETLVVRGLENGQRVLIRPPSFMDLGAVYTPVRVSSDEDMG